MCKVMENWLDEDRLEQIKNIATNMKVSYKQVIDSMKLTPEEKTKYLEALSLEQRTCSRHSSGTQFLLQSDHM